MHEDNGYGYFAYEDEYDYGRLLRNPQETKFSKKLLCTFDAAEYYYDIEECPKVGKKRYRTPSPTSVALSPGNVAQKVAALSHNNVGQKVGALSQGSIAQNITALSFSSFSWKRTWNSLLNFIYHIIPVSTYK